MMRVFRLSFVTRIAIIFIFSLVAIQLLAVMGYFIQRGSNTGTGFRLPFPDQVAAIVELIENAPAGQRSAVLRAVNGAQLDVRIETGMPPISTENWRASRVVERIVRRYLAALGERRVTVLIHKEERWLLPRLMPFQSPAIATIKVSLKGGETLSIQTGGPLSINIFGFPPGFWAGVVGFAVALLAIIIIRREVRPLRHLANAADSLNLSEPHPIADFPRSAPEIRAVISAFNRMQDRIASLIKARMAMIAGFSHDVRTYATRLRLRAELIGDEAERARAIRDIEDMISLLDDALLAVQDRPAKEIQELVDIPELIREEIEHRRRAGVRASFTAGAGAESALVLGSAVGLRRLFANLIDNAIAYGDEARASIELRGQTLIAAIEDSGPGIPKELRNGVMQAFVRLEVSRSRKTGGAGLGLAIARRVADSHGGRLAICDAEGGGARVTVELAPFDPDGFRS
jgi:signal transduction histidine kinase